ncbi:unnamed protein product [Auanema sp. JU1783]|nr:unnamed protein product [Auanema sp. JU1783]
MLTSTSSEESCDNPYEQNRNHFVLNVELIAELTISRIANRRRRQADAACCLLWLLLTGGCCCWGWLSAAIAPPSAVDQTCALLSVPSGYESLEKQSRRSDADGHDEKDAGHGPGDSHVSYSLTHSQLHMLYLEAVSFSS